MGPVLADGLDHRIRNRLSGNVVHRARQLVARLKNNAQSVALVRRERVNIFDLRIDMVRMEERDNSLADTVVISGRVRGIAKQLERPIPIARRSLDSAYTAGERGIGGNLHRRDWPSLFIN